MAWVKIQPFLQNEEQTIYLVKLVVSSKAEQNICCNLENRHPSMVLLADAFSSSKVYGPYSCCQSVVQVSVEYHTIAENSSRYPYGFLPQTVVLEHVQLLVVQGLCPLRFQVLHSIVILLLPPTEYQ